MTGAAIEALNAAGLHDTEAQQKAIGYLHQIQESDGGFPEFPSEGESNSGSTAWVVQGIWAAGENPETWTKSSDREPLDYLESMQQPDGRIRYRASEELNGVWMTAYTGPAYAGQPLPIPAPARNPNPSTPPSSSGQGGESSQAGSGVIAGGGGDGAPLFSRPQPRSKGHTPGGLQQLKREYVKAKHRRNPGSPRKTPVVSVVGSSSYRSKKSSHHNSTGTGVVQLTGVSVGDNGGGRVQEPEIKGVLIGAPADALAHGAPGLHSASVGSKQASWLTIAMAAALLLSFLLGAQLERRGGEAIL